MSAKLTIAISFMSSKNNVDFWQSLPAEDKERTADDCSRPYNVPIIYTVFG